MYETTVSISVTTNMEQEVNYINKLYDIDEEETDCSGLVNIRKSKKYGADICYMIVVFNPVKKDYMNTIAHELFHLTQEILETNRVYFKRKDTNETYAHLQGWLMGETYEFFEKAYNKFKRLK